VRALKEGQTGVMVVFQPPDLKFVPMTEAINKFRTVPSAASSFRSRGRWASLWETEEERTWRINM